MPFEVPNTNCIYISGLPQDVTEEDLAQHFAPMGIIKQDTEPTVWLYRDTTSGKLQGDGTVTYTDPFSAGSAVHWFNGQEFKGSTIEVKPADCKSTRLEGGYDSDRGGTGGGGLPRGRGGGYKGGGDSYDGSGGHGGGYGGSGGGGGDRGDFAGGRGGGRGVRCPPSWPSNWTCPSYGNNCLASKEWVEDTSYFGNRSAGFVKLADIVLVVEDNHFPAHSQILASSSSLIYHMLEDCSGFSKEQPLVLWEPLAGLKKADIGEYLCHSYQDKSVTSELAAMQLLTVADLFDSPLLVEKAVQFLESAKGELLKATCSSDGALHWLQLAERFDLGSFKDRCVTFVAAHFQILQQDKRMMQLSAATYCLLMRQLQVIIFTRRQVVLKWIDKSDRCSTTYYCSNGCKTSHVALWAIDQSRTKLHLYGFEGQGVAWCGASAGEGHIGLVEIDAESFPRTSEGMVAYLKGPLSDEQ